MFFLRVQSTPNSTLHVESFSYDLYCELKCCNEIEKNNSQYETIQSELAYLLAVVSLEMDPKIQVLVL